MNAFENLDELVKQLQPYVLYISIFALICLIGVVVFFFKYRWWKKTSNIEQSIAEELEIQIENDTDKHEKEIKQTKDELGFYTDEFKNASAELSRVTDELIKSNNLRSCAEGKIKKFETRVTAWELTARFVPQNQSELDEIHDKIWKDIKTS